MLLNLKSVLLNALLASAARRADAHSIEVLSCLTTTGNLRVFVRHWHNALPSVADADEMVIDGVALAPTGIINDVATLVSPWLDLFATGCSTPVVQEKVCTPQLSPNRDDYVYYDFPIFCDRPVSYVFHEGTTVILEDGCKAGVTTPPDPLYPLTISGTFTDTSPPVIFVNGQDCSSTFSIVVNAMTEDCDDPGTNVRFYISTEDDCDPTPTVTTSPASGSFFTLGSTEVTVTSTDAAGNTSTCTFTVIVSTNPWLCVITLSPTPRPTPPPVPPRKECLGCNFFSSVLGPPAGSGLQDPTGPVLQETKAFLQEPKAVLQDPTRPVLGCNMAMADMVIEGKSGQCVLNIFRQRECREMPCEFEATFKVSVNSRSCQGPCRLVVWDDAQAVIDEPVDVDDWGSQSLVFSYKAERRCLCRTHRIKAVFSCGREYRREVLTQRAEYTCSECERTPFIG